MKACIIGASGYTGRELVKLLLGHPIADLSAITSRAFLGKSLEDIIPQATGLSSRLKFTNPTVREICDSDIEIFFLALPHGTAALYAIKLIEAGKKVIDLSADFRLNSVEVYKEFYGEEHPAEAFLKIAQYGLPELNDLSWDKSKLIASPGCYPTSILIPLAPLVESEILDYEDIIINSMSGISGAGRNATEKLLYCERNENASAYGLPKHRHLSEIEEQLSIFAKRPICLCFHPHLIPMNRGICTTISAKISNPSNFDKIYECWNESYQGRAFTKILPTGTFPEVSHVVGTNNVAFSAHLDTRTKRVVICSTEDNLIKGAGGQAIQSFNVCEGLDETTGLL